MTPAWGVTAAAVSSAAGASCTLSPPMFTTVAMRAFLPHKTPHGAKNVSARIIHKMPHFCKYKGCCPEKQ